MMGCGPDRIESLIAGGRVVEFPSGYTVYAEADAEGLAVVMHGLLRVYMLAGDGRQVSVRYVRAGDLLGVPGIERTTRVSAILG